MLYLNLDENNYLLSIAKVGVGIKTDIDLAEFDLTGDRIRAYRWDGKILVFDAARYEIIKAEAETQQAKSEQPTELEQLRADIDYIAVMTGVEL